jgi:tetratricopeptide (TPR) repeat protein
MEKVMRIPDLVLKKTGGFIKTAVACLLIFAVCANVFAQYRGAPVQKERLLKALRSKQLQTGDIVTIINRNGVNFRLTEEARRALIAAGARPEIIRAAAENPRLAPDAPTTARRKNPVKEPPENYDELIDQAIHSYKDQKNPKNAARFLETALKMNPKDPKAYQMLGFVNLYGLNNPARSEKYMRESIENGGSAVFRVYHDDNGDFTGRCSGSLYVSPERIRFESDDNLHTFETSTVNIDKVRLDRESSKIWKRHPVFKIFLKLGKTEAKFRFAPITGSENESKMVARMVIESQLNRKPAGLAMNLK